MWAKYYSGLTCSPEDIYCDGCLYIKEDAKRIDISYPVRACVIGKGLEHCGYCKSYPCQVFKQREGLSRESAKANLGKEFNQTEYDEFLSAYDNKTRLDEFCKGNSK